MKTNNFTPGPWSVTHQTLTDQSWDIISEHPAGGTCVATCGCSADQQGYVAANARLMAAAPDLLSACRYALEAFDNDAHRGEGFFNGENPAIARIKAAILKAEGGE